MDPKEYIEIINTLRMRCARANPEPHCRMNWQELGQPFGIMRP